MSTNINTALIEIEKNLQDLASAREQVLEVTGTGRELAKTAAELTKKMNALYQAVNKDSASYNNAFDKSREDFQKRLKELTDKSEKGLSSFIENLNSVESGISHKISNITENASARTTFLLQKQEENFKKTLEKLNEYEKSIFTFSQYISDFDFDLKLDAVEDKVKTGETNTISAIKIFKHDSLKQMDVIVQSFKFENEELEKKIKVEQENLLQAVQAQSNELEKIQVHLDKRLAILENKQNNNTYITWGLIGALLIAVIFLLIKN